MDTMGMVMTRRRRFWTNGEKRSICLETCAPGVSVARVARRHGMNANLIFTWLRDPRFAPEAAVAPTAEDAVFLPVEISRGDAAPAEPLVAAADGRLVIDLAGGHRVVAGGGYDPEALGRLLRTWLS